MINIQALTAQNAALWEKACILPGREEEVSGVAQRLVRVSAKERYVFIANATGVPWWVIAVIHERESAQNFTRQLAQGDPLNQISRHVPRGRGPFFNHPRDPPGQDAFYRAALDALVACPPYAARWKDWTAGGALTLLLLYNGTGYEQYHHEVSPYDWGATDQEQRGKYTADDDFDPAIMDTQIGCAAMLKAMAAIDPDVRFAISPALPPAPVPDGVQSA
jgi:lysozyme family protein